MNNRERRLRDGYQQRQAEEQRERRQEEESDEPETQSSSCISSTSAHGGLSYTWVSFDEAQDITRVGVSLSYYGEGPGIKQWLRVKDDWTDLANFEDRCRRFGFPDTHQYGKLTANREDKVMRFDQNAL